MEIINLFISQAEIPIFYIKVYYGYKKKTRIVKIYE